MVERIMSGLMLSVLWLSFAALAVGLGLWLTRPGNHAALLLTGGLLGLFLIPVMKLADVSIAAVRERDWVTLAATLVVVVILLAFTLRDAAGLPQGSALP
ncbi:MAG: hypothetical protein H0U94_10515 [Acidobacteria bacterium]|nr:hypothetical protein [Acidobacteriota bacterium]